MAIPDGYGQVTHLFGGAALPLGAAVTYGFTRGMNPSPPAEFAEIFHDAFADNIMSQVGTSVTLLSTLVKFGPDATGPSAEFADPRTGGNAGTVLGPNTAFLVRKQTAMGGRAGRGRMYIPGVRETSADDAGVLQPASVALMQAEVDAFLVQVGAANVNLVVLHQAGSPLTTPTDITGLQVDGRVATQRRRLRR